MIDHFQAHLTIHPLPNIQKKTDKTRLPVIPGRDDDHARGRKEDALVVLPDDGERPDLDATHVAGLVQHVHVEEGRHAEHTPVGVVLRPRGRGRGVAVAGHLAEGGAVCKMRVASLLIIVL